MPTNPSAGALVFGKLITGEDSPIGATAPVAATGTLTLAGNAVAGETVTIGNQTATWVAAINSTNNQTPNLVLIAGSASDSIDNLIAWINATSTLQGSSYSYSGIPNPFVTAAQGAGDTMVITARISGANANQVVTTETMSQGSWGAATLTGGVAGALLTSGSGGGSSPAGVPVTVISAAVGASASGSIPIGAKGWTFTVLTGTATFNGVASLPAGFSESDVNTLVAAIAYSTASGSSAYVRYNT